MPATSHPQGVLFLAQRVRWVRVLWMDIGVLQVRLDWSAARQTQVPQEHPVPPDQREQPVLPEQRETLAERDPLVSRVAWVPQVRLSTLAPLVGLVRRPQDSLEVPELRERYRLSVPADQPGPQVALEAREIPVSLGVRDPLDAPAPPAPSPVQPDPRDSGETLVRQVLQEISRL